MATLIKALRYILFVPAAFISLGLMFTALLYLLDEIMILLLRLNNAVGIVLFLVILFFIGWGLVLWVLEWFNTLCLMAVFYISKISPSTKFSFYTFTIFSIMFVASGVYGYWFEQKTFVWFTVLQSVIATLLTIGLAHLIYKSAKLVWEDDQERNWMYREPSFGKFKTK